MDLNKIINEKEYLSFNSTVEYLGVARSYVYKLLKNNQFHCIKEKNCVFFPAIELINERNKIDALKRDYYTINQICDLLDISNSAARKLIKNLGIGFFNKMDRTIYVLKSDLNKYLKEKAFFDKNNYSIEIIASLMGTNTTHVRYLINEKNLFPGKFKVKQNWYVSKTEVDEYLKKTNFIKDDYLTVAAINEQYGFALSTCRKLARKFPHSMISGYSNNKWLIYKKDLDDYIQHRVKKYTNGVIKDVQEAYNCFLEVSKEMGIEEYLFKKTIELYNSFVLYKLKKSHARDFRKEIHRYKPPLQYMIKHISKEISKFNDEEILMFIANEELNTSNAIVLIQFLDYCRKIMGDSCNFTKNPKRRSRYNPSEYRETIPEDIFIQYYIYVIDMDINIKIALAKPQHAQLWIYIIIHLFVAWRASDIIFEFPPINLEQINILELDYFIENRLSKTEAQIVLNQYYVNWFMVNKTGVINGFNVPDSLIGPLATALVIAEIHRRKNNQDILLYLFKGHLPYKNDYKKFFKGNEELAAFGNLKASRTLLTLFYDYVSEESNCQELAHELARKLRSHAINGKFYITDTTSIYIQESNNDSKPNNLSKHIFDRDIFGWLYYIILGVLLDDTDFKKLSMETKTKLIVGLQNTQSPYQMEGLGKFLLLRQEKKMTLIEEIRSMPKMDLADKLRKLYQGLMPSEIPETQCFKYGECPNKQEDRSHRRHYCKKCRYLIPNKYFLVSLKNDIYDLIDLINELKDYQKAEEIKLRTLLFDDMFILQEALDEESGLGKETVDAFINREDLRIRLKSLR